MTTAPAAPPPGSEAAQADVLDALIARSGLFTSYAEVPGTLIQPRPGQVDKGMRIDRILVPTQQLVDAGWSHGVIGVETKPAGAKLGPALAQAMDYTRSAFTLPGGGFQVVPSWVFLFPFPKQHGPLASLMAQQRVGLVLTDRWTLLRFVCGEATVLRVGTDGTVRVGLNTLGRKAGRR